MSRRKKKPVTLSRMELKSAYVDNPDWRPDRDGEKAFPRKVPVVVNVRESAISMLAARTDNQGKPLIDPAQVEAATKFRRYWEAMGGSGAAAIDYSRDKVDGGIVADPIDIAQMNAARHLADAERTLGERNYELVRKVCGEGAAIPELFKEKRAKLTATDNLRASLDDLVRIWGIGVTASGRPSRKYQRASRHEHSLYTERTTNRTGRAKNG